MRILSLLFLIVFAAAGDAPAKKQIALAQQLRSGDIVFQYIPCGPLCEAIVETTPCAGEHPFNHCGIVSGSGHAMVIIEAIGKDVHPTPLADFLRRDTSQLLYVGRPAAASGIDPATVLRKAESLEGRPYDDAFLPGDSALYCSELVYACYTQHGRPAFRLEPMTFKSPRDGRFFPAWADYYAALGTGIPEGLPGINPCAISRSPLLRLLAFRKDGN